MITKKIAIATLSMLTSAFAVAGPVNLIQNGDFEMSNVAVGAFKYSNGFGGSTAVIDSWITQNALGVNNQSASWGGSASAVVFLQVHPTFGQNLPQISQSFSSTGGIFSISFDLAQRQGYGDVGYVDVTFDGQSVANMLNPIGTSLTKYSFTTSSLINGIHTLSFNGNNPSFGNDASTFLDNVTVSVVAVPEPETYGMLLAGLGMLGVIARRRKAA